MLVVWGGLGVLSGAAYPYGVLSGASLPVAGCGGGAILGHCLVQQYLWLGQVVGTIGCYTACGGGGLGGIGVTLPAIGMECVGCAIQGLHCRRQGSA